MGIRKKLMSTLAIVLIGLSALASSSPSLMVVPSDAWCVRNGFVSKFNNNGVMVDVPDYASALMDCPDCSYAINKINELLIYNGASIKNLADEISDIKTINSEGSLVDAPYNIIKEKADICIDLDWKVNQQGPRKTISIMLTAKNRSNRIIAISEDTSMPAFSNDIRSLLDDVIYPTCAFFTTEIGKYFQEIALKGREMIIDVKVEPNSPGINLMSDVDGEGLSDVICNWVSENSTNHGCSVVECSNSFLQLADIRLALFNADGQPNNVENWAKELTKMLSSKYPFTCQLKVQGFDKIILTLKEKE